jgi:hypothetical protein
MGLLRVAQLVQSCLQQIMGVGVRFDLLINFINNLLKLWIACDPWAKMISQNTSQEQVTRLPIR